MLALETVNSNVLGVTNSVPLRILPKFTRQHRRKCLSRGLKEIGSNWIDEVCHVQVGTGLRHVVGLIDQSNRPNVHLTRLRWIRLEV